MLTWYFGKGKIPLVMETKWNLTKMVTFGLDLHVQNRSLTVWMRREKNGTGKTDGLGNTQNFEGIESIPLEQ